MMIKVWVTLILATAIALVGGDIVVDMVRRENYPIETHYVTTEDGYILRLHRIPPKGDVSIADKYVSKVMFLMHGLLESSPTYLIRPNKESAGYFYADRGFDIWLGNARGNMFSRNHTTLNPDERPFWEFSFHEIGIYDLPATIDYILSVTNQTQIIYTGHSQGVTSLFVLLSERPEYNAKIALAHAMTPPIILKYNGPILHTLSQHPREFENWILSRDYYEFLPYEFFSKITKPASEICVYSIVSNVCKRILDMSFGATSTKNWHNHSLTELAINIPSGSSYRQILHYGQLSKTGIFQKFDHGNEENLKLYGTSHPPEYNFSNIAVKIHILYGTSDIIVIKENIPLLVKKLGRNVVEVTKMDEFNHIDFLYGQGVESIQKITAKVLSKYLAK